MREWRKQGSGRASGRTKNGMDSRRHSVAARGETFVKDDLRHFHSINCS